ncbi:MAG: tetratricopeptide repeat protein [Alphaproteobacteria bacterium]
MKEEINSIYNKILNGNDKALEELLRIANEENNSEAQFALGKIYLPGIVRANFSAPSSNLEESFKWMEKASVQGHEDARKELEKLKEIKAEIAAHKQAEKELEIKLLNFKEAEEQAFQDLIYKANNGDNEAMYDLWLESKNKDSRITQYKAIEVLQKAADTGHKTAQYDLAQVYQGLHNNQILERNMDQALYWYKEAAKNGEARACYSAAYICENGKNYKDAVFYYNKAIICDYDRYKHLPSKILELTSDSKLDDVKKEISKNLTWGKWLKSFFIKISDFENYYFLQEYAELQEIIQPSMEAKLESSIKLSLTNKGLSNDSKKYLDQKRHKELAPKVTEIKNENIIVKAIYYIQCFCPFIGKDKAYINYATRKIMHKIIFDDKNICDYNFHLNKKVFDAITDAKILTENNQFRDKEIDSTYSDKTIEFANLNAYNKASWQEYFKSFFTNAAAYKIYDHAILHKKIYTKEVSDFKLKITSRIGEALSNLIKTDSLNDSLIKAKLVKDQKPNIEFKKHSQSFIDKANEIKEDKIKLGIIGTVESFIRRDPEYVKIKYATQELQNELERNQNYQELFQGRVKAKTLKKIAK